MSMINNRDIVFEMLSDDCDNCDLWFEKAAPSPTDILSSDFFGSIFSAPTLSKNSSDCSKPEFCMDFEDSSEQGFEKAHSSQETTDSSRLSTFGAPTVDAMSVFTEKPLDELFFGTRKSVEEPSKETSPEWEAQNQESETPHQALSLPSLSKKASINSRVSKTETVVSLISKAIDKTPILFEEVSDLDSDQLLELSNFLYLLYGVSLVGSESLEVLLNQVNSTIKNWTDKKKRNEERIKYIFKRVNKLLFNNYTSAIPPSQREKQSKLEDLFVEKYLGSKSESSEELSHKHLKKLVFKPASLYRKDLNSIFSIPLYRREVLETLSNSFIEEFLKTRREKLTEYIEILRSELFLTSDKNDVKVLSRRMQRLPWSIHEIEKGKKLLLELVA